MFVAILWSIAGCAANINRVASFIAFVQILMVIGFPNVCGFIDDGDLAVKPRTDEDTTCRNVDAPWTLASRTWLMKVNFLILQLI